VGWGCARTIMMLHKIGTGRWFLLMR
jgi:hypothetical protein